MLSHTQLENNKLKEKIDTFLSSLKKLSPEEIIRRTDDFEHQIYQHIDAVLASYGKDNAKNIEEIFFEVQAFNDKLNALHNLHVKYPLLFFHSFNNDLIPETNKTEPALYLREQYHYFMEHCLAFDKKSIEKENIAVLIRKLISQPVGQRLIIKINQLHEQYTCYISVLEQAHASLSITPDKNSLRNRHDPMKDDVQSSVSPLKFFNHPRKSWNKVQLTYPPQFWEDPQFLFKALDFGKGKCLVFKPAFISFGHELTHALHFFRGKDRCKMPFQESGHTETLFMKNMEELWTIDLGNISENKLRAEHGIDLRYSHIRAFQFGEGPYSLSEIGETMGSIHQTHKKPEAQSYTNDLVILELKDDKPGQCCTIM